MIQIFKGHDDLIYVRHIAKNNKILSVSEGFKTIRAAFNNIRAHIIIYKGSIVRVHNKINDTHYVIGI